MKVRYPFRLGDQEDFVSSLASAIQQFEGWVPPGSPGFPNGSLSYRNNNPGNIRPVGGTGYRVYPTYEDGLADLKALIWRRISRGENLQEFFQGRKQSDGTYKGGYAPSADHNDPVGYAGQVATWLGIDTSSPLAQFATGAAPAPAVPGLTVPGPPATSDVFTAAGGDVLDAESGAAAGIDGSEAVDISSGSASVSAVVVVGVAGLAIWLASELF